MPIIEWKELEDYAKGHGDEEITIRLKNPDDPDRSRWPSFIVRAVDAMRVVRSMPGVRGYAIVKGD